MGSVSLYLIPLAVACIFISSHHSSMLVNCDQPVFVLETSDAADTPSSSFQSNEQPSISVAAKRDTALISSSHNTQIITDDNAPAVEQNVRKSHTSSSTATPSSSSTTSSSSSSNEHQHHRSTTHSPVITHSVQHSTGHESNQNNHQHKQSSVGDHHHNSTPTTTSQHHAVSKPADQQHSNSNGNIRDVETVRRLDESPAPSQRSTQTRGAPQIRSKASTTTTTPYPVNYQEQQPKTEERLLISITSDEDEYKPPQRQVIASTGGFEEVRPTPTSSSSSSSSSYQQQQPLKKKPAITISIQDNSSKQGGSGPPSVIVRPTENGQSIIISTLGSSGIETNNNNNKYNPNKPAIAIVSSGGQNNNFEPPYREPVLDTPIQHHNSNSNSNNHPASTHRPSNINANDYNPPLNKPIGHTLIDQPRPPANVMTQRPPIVSLNEDYEPQQRPPTHRPPTNQPDYNGNSNNNNNNNNNNNDDNDNAGSALVSGNNGGSKYTLNEKDCGLAHETRIVGGEEANPNDFLWMAAIVKSRPTDGEVRPFCGGSLITRRHILTAAHCLEGLAPRDVLVRLGSYDFDDATASPLVNDYAIDQFRKPAQYNKKTHVADIAIMRLKTPLQVGDNYKTVCMPQARRSYVGALGTVTGYGSQAQTFRRAAPKLRQVTVPIWENRKCSTVYKRNLTESFLCAGYDEGGKDACQGDSGGPLMTDGPNDRTIVVGVVSHGIGCGSPGYPGVYTRISTFLDWIEENTRE